MKILITGGAGFIGSHLCDLYTKNKHNTVICLDNFMNGNLVNIRHLLTNHNFKLITGDIRNHDLLEKLMRDVDVVFHLAAQIHVDRSIIEPRATYDINVLGTQNILEVARIYDVEKIIYASTSEVYGSAQHASIDENHLLDAPHPYGASKIAADRMCSAYNETYGMKIYIMRSFNTYGARQKDTGYGGAISIFTRRVLNDKPPLIYGDGQQTRDYLYIEDAISAYNAVFKTKKRITTPINFGTGVETKIVDIATTVIELCGKTNTIQPVYIEPRPGEVNRLVADIKLAKAYLNWTPQYTLSDGLQQFITWYSDHKTDTWENPL